MIITNKSSLGSKPTTQDYMDSMLHAGKYEYMEDLQTPSSRVPTTSVAPPTTSWDVINTPLNVDEWHCMLKEHPDSEYAEYLLQGMTEGLTITSTTVKVQSEIWNQHSTTLK